MIDSWARVALIFCVIVLNGMLEELLILWAEFMMLVRWIRVVIQEKATLILRGRLESIIR
jgi:hypothetical protein